MSQSTHHADQDALIGPGHTMATLTDKISDIVLTKKHPLQWFAITGIAAIFASLLALTVLNLFFTGIGVWGPNNPVGWGFDIINFVWWIGIGHAGTLISAILLLLRQEWRTSINRSAEAMTVFAVMCAGMYPLLHTGRPWLAYWLLPIPNSMGMWPQFRSPLIWDVFAVSTYATVSMLFWYVGLIPDFAVLRDKATKKIQKVVYGMLALGWRNAARHWDRYETAYLLLAGMSTPLVLSVHTVVSFDFAAGIVPGWHTTVFPPYFVAGAIFAGFAMVLTLSIPLRIWYGVDDLITDKHLDNMAKVLLATGWIVTYGYGVEAFMCFYSGSTYEEFMLLNRLKGPYAFQYWSLLLTNCVLPQIMWIPKLRRNIWALYFVAMSVNIGMWLERYVIIVVSLHRDFLPSSWGMYAGSRWDWAMFLGTLGFFTTMFMLFIRFLPMISIAEMKALVPHKPGLTTGSRQAAAHH
ncbi:MAG: NrfD/PsrC family molybdoenzyme membrane anchor subunit [Planctomycetota bacterium]